MGLEEFKSDSNSDNEDDKWVSENGIDWTCCSCDISEVGRLEEPVDELDLIAHMRAEHEVEFEEAKKQVSNRRMEVNVNQGGHKMGDVLEEKNWSEIYD